jgi:hypothetical protein
VGLHVCEYALRGLACTCIYPSLFMNHVFLEFRLCYKDAQYNDNSSTSILSTTLEHFSLLSGVSAEMYKASERMLLGMRHCSRVRSTVLNIHNALYCVFSRPLPTIRHGDQHLHVVQLPHAARRPRRHRHRHAVRLLHFARHQHSDPHQHPVLQSLRILRILRCQSLLALMFSQTPPSTSPTTHRII